MRWNFSHFSIGFGIFTLILALPMALRWVPMNEIYGARFEESYHSKEAWYSINAYAGKTLAAYAIIVLAIGFSVQAIPLGSQTTAFYKLIVLAPVAILARIIKSHARTISDQLQK